MRTAAPRDERVFEEAAEWVVELRERGSPAPDATRFVEWLRRSPEHVAAYFEIAAVWEDIPRLIPLHGVDVNALIDSARSEPDFVSHRARPLFRPVAWAAVLLVCVGLAVASWFQLRPQTYATQVGEQRSITLDDGSTIELDTKSRVRVHLAAEARTVDLIEGQALFHVAHDNKRPFVVSCDDMRVRAVGTQFDVYRKSSGAKIVTVVEGRVALLPGTGSGEVLLGAGDQATVTAEGAVQSQPGDASTATAWRQRNVVFHGAALSEVVAEFNRYSRKQMVLDDAKLQSVRINGVFSSTNPASLLVFLREQLGVPVRESDTAIHIGRGE